jgi:putative YhbY family RNA-binding protein
MDETALELTPAERKALRARAHHLKPVVMIGESGLTDAVLAETRRALASHELIKVRVLGDDRDLRAGLMPKLCEAAGAAPVQAIGKLLVIWRPADASARPGEAASAPAKKKRPRGPRLTKKAAGAGQKVAKRIRKTVKGASIMTTGAKKSAAAKKPAAARKPAAGRKSAAAKAGAVPRPSSTAPTAKKPTAKKPAAKKPAAKKPVAKKPVAKAPAAKKPSARSARTAGKRTDLASALKITPHHGQPSPATQGPVHLQGKPGARTSGRRDRAKRG